MAKSALTTLLLNAAYNLEIGTPSTSTDPTKAEMTVWANEVQRDIARKVPSWALRDLEMVYNPSIAAVSTATISAIATAGSCDLLKFSRATLNVSGSGNDRPMRLISQEEAAMLSTNAFMADTDSPILWFGNDGAGNNSINWSPTTTGTAATGKLKFYYIKVPTAMSGDADTPAIPIEYEDAIVHYITYKGFAQAEEWQPAQLYYQYYAQAVMDSIQTLSQLFGFK